MTIVPQAIAAVLGTDVRPDAEGHEGSRPDGLHWYLRHRPGVTPVINDAAATRMMASAALVAGGPDAVCDTAHSWGGDTFGWYQGLVPGCYARLGTHWPGRPDRLDLHRPDVRRRRECDRLRDEVAGAGRDRLDVRPELSPWARRARWGLVLMPADGGDATMGPWLT